MLEIWGRRNASNVMPVLWAVGELGLAHRRHDVGGSFGGLDTREYLALNPNGRIPTIDDEGCIVWESNAIVRYLCRRYGERTLLPDDEVGRAHADQWMEWHKTTLYPPYIDLFWAIVRTEPALRAAATIERLSKSLRAPLALLDAQLAGRPYVAGERLSMADIPIGPAIHRLLRLPVERLAIPHVEAWYARLCERPAFQEHVMFPYGSNPAEWYLYERGGQRGGMLIFAIASP
jgi:glutathione S-transferase